MYKPVVCPWFRKGLLDVASLQQVHFSKKVQSRPLWKVQADLQNPQSINFYNCFVDWFHG